MLSSNTSAVSGDAVYVEDVFSTYLYTGTGANQTVPNGIDLSTKGGLVWLKQRNGAGNHYLTDSAVGYNRTRFSNTTDADQTYGVIDALTNGFTDKASWSSSQTVASWTFRKQPKFFDIVTYTGNGVAGRRIAHNLGSVPGCIIVKSTTYALGWPVYHRSFDQYTNTLFLDSNAAVGASKWNEELPTSNNFPVSGNDYVNKSGETYVAYILAHDAGGFGLTGTDNVISCGSFNTDANGIASVTLGYEVQYLLVKRTNDTQNWLAFDNMRGMPNGSDQRYLSPNSSIAEQGSFRIYLSATGFTTDQFSINSNFIYIAIRKGPMKVPTDATKVFAPITLNAPGTGTQITTNFPIDLSMAFTRTGGDGSNTTFVDRLRGFPATNTSTGNKVLVSSSTAAEYQDTAKLYEWDNTGAKVGTAQGGNSFVDYFFKRAPGFFDVVCYSGTSSIRTVNHNLTAAPELIITKVRGPSTSQWGVYAAPLTATKTMYLNGTGAAFSFTPTWNDTEPTSTVFTLGNNTLNNEINRTMVAYLFASCPGVSKVGSYTGTGSTQTINCGFTGGARFVLVKRTDSTGDWRVVDTARGMVSGNDPYLRLNTTDGEVNVNNLYTATGGFQLVSSDTNFNANGGTYIYLAIA